MWAWLKKWGAWLLSGVLGLCTLGIYWWAKSRKRDVVAVPLVDSASELGRADAIADRLAERREEAGRIKEETRKADERTLENATDDELAALADRLGRDPR